MAISEVYQCPACGEPVRDMLCKLTMEPITITTDPVMVVQTKDLADKERSYLNIHGIPVDGYQVLKTQKVFKAHKAVCKGSE